MPYDIADINAQLNPLKLHLGCREKKIHGYINVDIRAEVNPDVVDDALTLSKFKDNSVSVIYACHMLEHVPRKDYFKTLKRWYKVLKPGGILRVSVPDLEALSQYLVYNFGNADVVIQTQNLIFGAQQHAYDVHYQGFTEDSLGNDLFAVGFNNIHRYDWRMTEHFYIDDYSQCYLPQISYKTRRPDGIIDGTLVSLNIEATK